MVGASIAPDVADRYLFSTGPLVVQTEHPNIRALFATTFSEFANSAGKSADEPATKYTVRMVDGEFLLACNAQTIYRAASWQAAYSRLEWQVSQTVLASTTSGLAIHAASVARYDRALLLVGPSGAGKSTLTLALVRGGMSYMSDEAAILDPTTALVTGFPRALVLKAECQIANQSLLDIPGRTYFTPAALGWEVIRGPLPPAALIFIAVSSGEAPALRPLSRSEALSRLLSQVYAHGPVEMVFATLTKLLTRAIPLSQTIDSPEIAARQLLELTDRLSGH